MELYINCTIAHPVFLINRIFICFSEGRACLLDLGMKDINSYLVNLVGVDNWCLCQTSSFRGVMW